MNAPLLVGIEFGGIEKPVEQIESRLGAFLCQQRACGIEPLFNRWTKMRVNEEVSGVAKEYQGEQKQRELPEL
jgi:hypothetical protein